MNKKGLIYVTMTAVLFGFLGGCGGSSSPKVTTPETPEINYKRYVLYTQKDPALTESNLYLYDPETNATVLADTLKDTSMRKVSAMVPILDASGENVTDMLRKYHIYTNQTHKLYKIDLQAAEPSAISPMRISSQQDEELMSLELFLDGADINKSWISYMETDTRKLKAVQLGYGATDTPKILPDDFYPLIEIHDAQSGAIKGMFFEDEYSFDVSRLQQCDADLENCSVKLDGFRRIETLYIPSKGILIYSENQGTGDVSIHLYQSETDSLELLQTLLAEDIGKTTLDKMTYKNGALFLVFENNIVAEGVTPYVSIYRYDLTTKALLSAKVDNPEKNLFQVRLSDDKILLNIQNEGKTFADSDFIVMKSLKQSDLTDEKIVTTMGTSSIVTTSGDWIYHFGMTSTTTNLVFLQDDGSGETIMSDLFLVGGKYTTLFHRDAFASDPSMDALYYVTNEDNKFYTMQASDPTQIVSIGEVPEFSIFQGFGMGRYSLFELMDASNIGHIYLMDTQGVNKLVRITNTEGVVHRLWQ
ncbi:MAG: hypothetical protein K0U47_10090 [Epsilonproteobacteria bacterium]|nr:hypothetical protein [Campylobacterota bacterium]